MNFGDTGVFESFLLLTALHYASTHDHPGVVCFLIKKHCKINARDDEKSTPLIKAVQRENEDCVAILLKNGADPHAVDIFGNNALHYAVLTGNISIVEQLINFSADIEAPTKKGFTPFVLSLHHNQEMMAEFLKCKGADVHAEVRCRSEAKREKPVKPPRRNRILTQLNVRMTGCSSTSDSNPRNEFTAAAEDQVEEEQNCVGVTPFSSFQHRLHTDPRENTQNTAPARGDASDPVHLTEPTPVLGSRGVLMLMFVILMLLLHFLLQCLPTTWVKDPIL